MNQVSDLPFVLDTKADVPIRTGQHYIRHVEYVGYNSGPPTDVVELVDQNGNLIWRGTGLATLQTIPSGNIIGWVNGLMLPVNLQGGVGPNMPTGKLIVYIK